MTSASPRSVRNNALSAGPPNGPEVPFSVASPFLEEIIFSITQGELETPDLTSEMYVSSSESRSVSISISYLVILGKIKN